MRRGPLSQLWMRVQGRAVQPNPLLTCSTPQPHLSRTLHSYALVGSLRSRGCGSRSLGAWFSTKSTHAKIAELCEVTGYTAEAVGKMVAGYPSLLGYNATKLDLMRAKLTELGKMTGCSEKAVEKMVAGHPPLLGLNADSMRAKITELSEMTGCSEKAVGKMVAGFPPLLGYNADSMRAKITELSEMTGCSEKAVGKMVAGWPPLLGLNADSMRAKLAFLLENFGSLTLAEVTHRIRFLSFSLEKRLKPRYHFAVQQGTQSQLCRKSVAMPDEQFARVNGATLEEYTAFKENYIRNNDQTIPKK